jgi:hypothetical protein
MSVLAIDVNKMEPIGKDLQISGPLISNRMHVITVKEFGVVIITVKF